MQEEYINIIKNIYSKCVSRVKLGRRGEEIKLGKGVRQGDPISPKLFIAVLELVFHKINWSNRGLAINNQNISHLRFADDIVLFAKSAIELKQMLQTLNKESNKVVLQMNSNKTKVTTNGREIPIYVNEEQIEYVNKYVYLGKLLSFNVNSNEEEVDRRINITWKKYWSQKEILKGNYNYKLKKIVMDTSLLPCLTYGSQTWVFTNTIKNKITTKKLKIRWIHKIRNSFIRSKTKLTVALQHSLNLKWKWAGHISRHKDRRWSWRITKWIGPPGKRKVGKPKKRWLDDIVHLAGRNWMSLAQDRIKWKALGEAFT